MKGQTLRFLQLSQQLQNNYVDHNSKLRKKGIEINYFEKYYLGIMCTWNV